MNISTKTVTTRTHIGSFSADEIKAVALSYATKQAGVTDAASIVSSKVDVAGDGSVTVEIVEAGSEPATAPKPGTVESSIAPLTQGPEAVSQGVVAPSIVAPAPGFASGFGGPRTA